MLGCLLLRTNQDLSLPDESRHSSYCLSSTSSDELGLLTEQRA